MEIGIISDTHNDKEMTIRAINLFKSRGIQFIVHGGDFTSPKILELFFGLKIKAVLGNNDIDSELLNKKAMDLGFEPIEHSIDFELEGKRFMLFHGDDVPLFRNAVAAGKYDYIIKGHTHFFENYISHNTRIINPGTVFHGEEQTIAILDVTSGRVEKISFDAE